MTTAKPLQEVDQTILPGTEDDPLLAMPCIICDERVTLTLPIMRLWLLVGSRKPFAAHETCRRFFQELPSHRQRHLVACYPL